MPQDIPYATGQPRKTRGNRQSEKTRTRKAVPEIPPDDQIPVRQCCARDTKSGARQQFMGKNIYFTRRGKKILKNFSAELDKRKNML